MALRASGSIEGGLIARTVQRSEMRAVASREYLARMGTPHKAADLVGHHCLVFSSDGRSPRLQWPLKNGRTVRVKSVLTANSFALLRMAACRGRGIALLRSIVVEADLRSARLVHVLPDVIYEKSLLAVVYAERQFVSPAVRAFVAWMSTYAGEPAGSRARRPPRRM